MGRARRGRLDRLKERGSGSSLSILDMRGPRDPVMFATERFGTPRLPGASLRSFPSPLSGTGFGVRHFPVSFLAAILL